MANTAPGPQPFAFDEVSRAVIDGSNWVCPPSDITPVADLARQRAVTNRDLLDLGGREQQLVHVTYAGGLPGVQIVDTQTGEPLTQDHEGMRYVPGQGVAPAIAEYSPVSLGGNYMLTTLENEGGATHAVVKPRFVSSWLSGLNFLSIAPEAGTFDLQVTGSTEERGIGATIIVSNGRKNPKLGITLFSRETPGQELEVRLQPDGTPGKITVRGDGILADLATGIPTELPPKETTVITDETDRDRLLRVVSETLGKGTESLPQLDLRTSVSGLYRALGEEKPKPGQGLFLA